MKLPTSKSTEPELVNLLLEAREYIHGCQNDGDEPCECDECEKATDLLNRIDNLLDKSK